MKGIADYRFLEEIGPGHHHRCFLAVTPDRLPLNAERVAVKLLSRRATPSEFRSVADELRLYAAIESEKLVPVYDVGYSEGAIYYAMPVCAGGSLAAPAHSSASSRAVRAVADAARGAHALHEIGVVHRNIKPSNILLGEGGARLSDLGLARLFAPGLTSTGVGFMATVEYTEPSMLAGRGASRLTDIWSLGLTLHRALTGASVYPGLPNDDPMEASRRVLRERPVLSDALDGEVREIIGRCTSDEDGGRFRTAAQLADALDGVAVAG
jgi:serine/threonine protein kinase